MSQPVWLKKYLRMKPEVNQIYHDLEEYLNYCRFELIDFNPKDLYKSDSWKKFNREKLQRERR